jgi:hypothetical protein
LAIRQEMGIVLLPLALAAAGSRRRWRKTLSLFAMVVAVGLLVLAAQRRTATGRFALSTEHGALGLFGSFVPGASGPGWIDARAYADALVPGTTGDKLFGDPRTLVRLTFAEARRRPAFHALRIATWPLRLAVSSDSENLFWSVAAPRALPESRREAGRRFAESWRSLLRVELSLITGLFLGAVLLGAARRDAAVLAVASAVALKLLIHAVVSPLARLVVPAVALELLTIAAATRLWRPAAWRALVGVAGTALVSSALLHVCASRAEAWITHRDDPALPGVRQFTLAAGPRCTVRCELESGQVVGLAPGWVRLRATTGSDASLMCRLPLQDGPERIALRAANLTAGSAMSVRALNGASLALESGSRIELASDAPSVRIQVTGPETAPAEGTISFEQ